MIDRALSAVGLDAIQWRALTRAYLLVDRRSSGGLRRAPASDADGPFLSKALIGITTFNGVMLAVVTAATPDPFTAASFAATYTALTVALMVVLEFAAVVISPNDYWIVGSRPVDSRTYFAARLASVLAYIVAIASLMGLLPALAFLIWHRAGVLVSLASFVSTVLCAATGSVLTIAAYGALVTRVRPGNLTRVLSVAQLLSPTMFLAAYFFAMRAVQESLTIDVRLSEIRWVFAIPSTWFAALVPLAQGTASSAEAVAAGAAALLAAAAIPAAAGRFSMTFSERLGDVTSAAAPGAKRTGRAIAGFSEGEAYAVATLIRAQFRYDARFRMAVLTILPITAFYFLISLDGGALKDPFTDFGAIGGVPLYFAITFVPMSLHGNLQYSENWRAAWIFAATPADHARLAVAAKNFVAIFFLGGYLLLLAMVWSFFYERVWHAFLHAAVFGAVAHFLLQAALIVNPVVPFTNEPAGAQRSSQLMWVFAIGSIVAVVAPVALPFIYAHWASTAGLVVVLIATTAGLEVLVRRRARDAALDWES